MENQTVVSEITEKIVKDQVRIKEVEALLKTHVDLDKKMSCYNELTWLKSRIALYKMMIQKCQVKNANSIKIYNKLSPYKAIIKESLESVNEIIGEFEVALGITSDDDEPAQMSDMQAKIIECHMTKRTEYEAQINAIINISPLFAKFPLT